MNALTIARIRRFLTGPTRNEILAYVLRERERGRRLQRNLDRVQEMNDAYWNRIVMLQERESGYKRELNLHLHKLQEVARMASDYEGRLHTIARHADIDNEQDPTHE